MFMKYLKNLYDMLMDFILYIFECLGVQFHELCIYVFK